MTPETYCNYQDSNDCVVRALANAAGMTYADAFELCEAAGRKRGRGMKRKIWLPLFEQHIEMKKSEYLSSYGSVRSLSKKMTERGGVYVVQIRRHLAVFNNGQWLDWLDDGRMHRVIAVWKVA